MKERDPFSHLFPPFFSFSLSSNSFVQSTERQKGERKEKGIEKEREEGKGNRERKRGRRESWVWCGIAYLSLSRSCSFSLDVKRRRANKFLHQFEHLSQSLLSFSFISPFHRFLSLSLNPPCLPPSIPREGEGEGDSIYITKTRREEERECRQT